MTELAQKELNPFDKFIRYLFTREISNVQAIFGRRGTGKTDFALLIAEILYTLEILKHLSTNVKILKSPFEIQRITNLEDLKFWAKERRGKKLFVFDEVGRTISRRKPMSSLNVALINEFQILRKYKLSTIYITIDPDYVDNAILGTQILDGVFYRPFYKRTDRRFRKTALYEDKLERFTKDIFDIPKANITFDTWDSAIFTEHGKSRKPRFKTKELDNLWDLSHGKTPKELGLHSMQVSRLWKKYVKEVMERDSNSSRNIERVATAPPRSEP